ncbi:helix-turn-helix domain-containing protein [Gordonia sp. (in: high G+C Gram-positive bacteria)]|uniref:helix-turn-helix domain-containing protein n=1 Tax=Gordonia sp. (in: high G+C Gram-positive bacteria) TaxID=84139 RepID=UPI0039E25A61
MSMTVDRVPTAIGGFRSDPDGVAQTPYGDAVTSVIAKAVGDLDGAPLVLLAGDHQARAVTFDGAHVLLDGMGELGMRPGVVLAEDEIGVNAIGTPVELRAGVFVRGPEHGLQSFHDFSCYGEPIIHPITRRLEGVMVLGGPAEAENGYYPMLAKRLAGEVADVLHATSPSAHRRLFAAFRTAAQGKSRAVVAVTNGLILATPTALDMIGPDDHAALRAYARDCGARSTPASFRYTLASGVSVDLRCSGVDGVDGSLLEMVGVGRRQRRRESESAIAFPLLIVGEVGSGRTHRAVELAGERPVVTDAADVVREGERGWTDGAAGLLETGSAPVVVENVQLLSEASATLLARAVARARRPVVLTTTPGEHLREDHAALVAVCADREELVPLRRRSHDIPRLAREMLSRAAPLAGLRFTPQALDALSAQPWPGNLTELRRVVDGVARKRSAGDLTVADLPETHRHVGVGESPLRRAEREAIEDAIAASGGNRQRAAARLGISRSTLYNRMRSLKITA